MIVAISEQNSSAIVAICGFHIIATIAEKVNEGRGNLRLTHCSRHSSNSTWRLWIIDSCLKVVFLYLWVLFNVNDDGKDKEPIDFGFERSSRRGNFRILLSGTQCILVLLLSLQSLWSVAIAGEWFPYDRYDRWDRTDVYLSDRCRCDRWYDRCDRWRVVSIWSLRSLNFFVSDRSDHIETSL